MCYITHGFVHGFALAFVAWVFSVLAPLAWRYFPNQREDVHNSMSNEPPAAVSCATPVPYTDPVAIPLHPDYLRSMKQPVFRMRLKHVFSANKLSCKDDIRDPCSDAAIFLTFLRGSPLHETRRVVLDDVVTTWLSRVNPTDAAQLSVMLMRRCQPSLGKEEVDELWNVLYHSFMNTPKYCVPNCRDPKCPWICRHTMAAPENNTHLCECTVKGEHALKAQLSGSSCCCCFKPRTVPVPAHCSEPSCSQPSLRAVRDDKK